MTLRIPQGAYRPGANFIPSEATAHRNAKILFVNEGVLPATVMVRRTLGPALGLDWREHRLEAGRWVTITIRELGTHDVWTVPWAAWMGATTEIPP